MKDKRRRQAELELKSLPEPIFAIYCLQQDKIVLDAEKLTEFVNEMVNAAREVCPDPLDMETVWIAKFASLMSHEGIHRVLNYIEGKETSHNFDKLHFPAFMGKVPESSIDIQLWSDAYETCPIGDTWFA
jgi:hypothetical protein